ncbi:MAG: ribonuclease III [Betaproteobacteria bacterium]
MTHSGLEAKLGHVFADPSLRRQALTHRSFGVPNNERLEFLGDSVLNCAVTRLIYERFPGMPEGELSRLRSNLVNQAVLAEIAVELGTGEMIRLGEGELKTGGASRPSILADSVEALLGAVFLDAGFDVAAVAVNRLFSARVNSTQDGRPAKDAKTALQEWLQAQRLPLPKYTVIKIEGEAHQQVFHLRCEVDSQGESGMAEAGCVASVGSGPNRRMAEQDAAAQVLAQIQQQTSRKKSA